MVLVLSVLNEDNFISWGSFENTQCLYFIHLPLPYLFFAFFVTFWRFAMNFSGLRNSKINLILI